MNLIKNRVIEEALYTLKHKSTVRQTAKHFGLGKSTIHKDLTKKLSKYDKELSAKVRKILDLNFNEKHIRGGQSTQSKFKTK